MTTTTSKTIFLGCDSIEINLVVISVETVQTDTDTNTATLQKISISDKNNILPLCCYFYVKVNVCHKILQPVPASKQLHMNYVILFLAILDPPPVIISSFDVPLSP